MLRPWQSWRVVLALLAMYLLWGTTYLVTKQARTEFPPLLLVGVRYTIAGLLFAAVIHWQKRPWGRPREWAHAALAGFLMLTLGAGLTTVVLPQVNSGVASVLFAAVPLLICVALAALGQRVNKAQWLGTLVGLLGLLLIVGQGESLGDTFSLYMLLGAVLATTAGALVIDRLALPQDLMTTACVQMLSGGLITTLAGWCLGERVQHLSPTALAQLAYLTVCVAVLAYFSYLYLMAHVGPVLANSYAYVNPPIALWAGAWVLHETVTPGLLLATVVVLCGAAIVLRWSPGPGAQQRTQQGAS